MYEFSCEITGNPEPDYVTWSICDESGNICRNEKKYKPDVSYFFLLCLAYQSNSFIFE
jgi:hypothetical protein